MGFDTPQPPLKKYLERTTSGTIQLPDFQREYKWDDERIRQLLVTVLKGHPMGAVMLLETGNENVRFKPRPLEGDSVTGNEDPKWLLLDGQQRLTSLTQAMTGDGMVHTKDKKGRRYFIDIEVALDGEERMDEAVVSVPAEGRINKHFGKEVMLDVSTRELEIEQRYFPVNLIFDDSRTQWLIAMNDSELFGRFDAELITPAQSYAIPAIELDTETSKSAVTTVFEKVNTGGLALDVFELLTATFAGDADHLEAHGDYFRLNEDWAETKELFSGHDVLSNLKSTDFLKAVLLLTTRERRLAWTGEDSAKAPAVTSKNEDVLKLSLTDYLKWRDEVRSAFLWASTFMADRHIYRAFDVPYGPQLVPLAALRVILGADTDAHASSERLIRWYWCGVLGEQYGGSSDTVFARDVLQVPDWVRGVEGAATRPW